MQTWDEVGNRAFQMCCRIYRKTEDYEEAIQGFDEEIAEAMEANGIEFDSGWNYDLSTENIVILLKAVGNANKAEPDWDMSPLHTHIINAIFEVVESGMMDKNIYEELEEHLNSSML